MAVNNMQFRRVLRELRDNGDFFDNFYLQNPDLYEPLDEEFVHQDMAMQAKSIGITTSQMWEVIDFLQSYSDVDLTAMEEAKKHGRSTELIFQWWQMYLANRPA